MTTTAVPRLFLTRREAATACGVSRETIRAAINSGKLRAKRTGPNGGGRDLIKVADLEAWFERLLDA